MSFVFRHRLVRLQNPQACVSDLRLLTQFSMICQGTRSVNVLANGYYMRFDHFVKSYQTINLKNLQFLLSGVPNAHSDRLLVLRTTR